MWTWCRFCEVRERLETLGMNNCTKIRRSTLGCFQAKLSCMKQMTRRIVTAAALLALFPAGANGQSFATTGSRAVGMGGAFVGVADDASAIYWNPGGLAAGAFFSLLVDWGTGEAIPDSERAGRDGSSFLIGLTTPALGFGYYRLHDRRATPVPFALVPIDLAPSAGQLTTAGGLRIDSLITHHTGLTLVQSITQGVAVGSTLKVVRGVAASQNVLAGSADEALGDDAAELLGHASNQFDLDVGLMAYGGPLKVGLTLRNLREPSFRTAGGGLDALVLQRQVRAGLSYAVSAEWLVAADLDLVETDAVFGPRRDVAVGVEGTVLPTLTLRSGLSVNTAGDAGKPANYSFGASYAVRGSVFIDGHFTAGDERAGTTWGAAARFVY